MIPTNRRTRYSTGATVVAVATCLFYAAAEAVGDQPAERLAVSWNDKFLTVRGQFPGNEVKILYLEAYCRAGSTNRDWSETVIAHSTQKLAVKEGASQIRLRDTLADGVIVDHLITAKADEIDFQLMAKNPTDRVSQVCWAQPCIRVDKFTGAGAADARELVPAYAKKCFLIVDGNLTRLPTTPWVEKARYTPGQVYCPRGVDRNDVNPRPLSPLVPSNSLCGCYSADEKMILAIAWQPYQEVFQGVIACMHCDFRIGGLDPGESKQIRGKLYITPADTAKLLARHKLDFPEQHD